jgi:four helix bundle protein
MPFDAFEVALDLVRSLRGPLATLDRRDPSLAQQLRRAAASVPLNLGEGRRRSGKDRLHLWRVAAGSADEVAAGLRVAEAFGHLDGASAAPALGLCDRVLAMLWRLTH